MAKAEFHKRLMDLQDNLLSFALKLTSNYDDAHDLLQDTTCKALVNDQKYVDASNSRSPYLGLYHYAQDLYQQLSSGGSFADGGRQKR